MTRQMSGMHDSVVIPNYFSISVVSYYTVWVFVIILNIFKVDLLSGRK